LYLLGDNEELTDVAIDETMRMKQTDLRAHKSSRKNIYTM